MFMEAIVSWRCSFDVAADQMVHKRKGWIIAWALCLEPCHID